MNLKTFGALALFVLLAATLMVDKQKQDQSTEQADVQNFQYDLALSSGEMVYSDAIQRSPSGFYLISPNEIDSFKSHSSSVILDTLDALPAFSASVLAAHGDGAESNSVNQ